MKILLVHLSDLHIFDSNGYNRFQIQKIVDAMVSEGPVNRVLVIVSGDLAYSGTQDQYHTVRKILNKIYWLYNGHQGKQKGFFVFTVPGNHDLHYDSKGPMSIGALSEIRKNAKYETYIDDQLHLQQEYFAFADKEGWKETNRVLNQRVLDFGNYSIELNMLNSALFSIFDEDKGLHYFPQYCVNKLREPTGADMVITVMHHSPDYLTDEIKNQVEPIIYGKSTLVLFGHEHYTITKGVSIGAHGDALVQAGGALCVNDNWKSSSFHLGVIDSDSNTYDHKELVWNTFENQYEPSHASTVKLNRKPSVEQRLIYTDQFQQFLNSDDKHRNIPGAMSAYYVFPRIEESDTTSVSEKREFLTIDSFFNEIISRKKILITGEYNSGKTQLIKHLCQYFNDHGFLTLYCNIDRIHGKNFDRMIRDCIEDVYGEGESINTRFKQTESAKRIAFIDDFDQIAKINVEQFLKNMYGMFDYVVLSSRNTFDWYLVDSVKTQLQANDSSTKYRITPFYADKRQELINKVVFFRQGDVNLELIVDRVINAINLQKRFISMTPDFIISYTEFFCNNLDDQQMAENAVFGKIFEANITNSLTPFKTARLSVDKMFVLLSKIAYFIHFSKSYPVTQQQLTHIIDEYNDEYGADVNYHDVLSIMLNSRILTCVNGDNSYRFVNRSHLAYFAAKEVNARFAETNDTEDLKVLLNNACFGINADILLFVSYITDNNQILKFILLSVDQLTHEWEEFDFDNNLPAFLKMDCQFLVASPEEDESQKSQMTAVETEKQEDDIVQSVDLYDYSDDEANQLINQIIRSFALLSLCAKILPNFEHALKKAEKDSLVDLIYTLPNKIFFRWASEMQNVVPEIVRYFKQQSFDYYQRKKPVEDDDIIRALQWSSISLLLDLYHSASINAARDNSMKYLNDFPYQNKATNSLEHLMFLERTNNAREYVKEAERIGLGTKKVMPSLALKRVVRHAMIYMKQLDFRDRQQLGDSILKNDANDKKMIVIQRATHNKED